jgi:hypothetical protein
MFGGRASTATTTKIIHRVAKASQLLRFWWYQEWVPQTRCVTIGLLWRPGLLWLNGRNHNISILQGASRPTGASAADRGVRPTK